MPEITIANRDVSPAFSLWVNGVDHSGLCGAAVTVTADVLTALEQSHLGDDIALVALRSLTVPTITGTPTEGQTLTAHDGTWNNTPVSLAYQWEADAAAIDGATASTYVLTAGEVGAVIAVTVTATDTTGSAAATSAATAAVAGA